MQKTNLKRLAPTLLVLTGLALPYSMDHVVNADEATVEPVVAVDHETEPADQKLLVLLQDLASEKFEDRVSASGRLKQLNAEELKRTVQLVAQQSSAEAIVRLLTEVDDRYVSDNPDDVAAASAALETLAIESRQLIADGAQHSLAHHWLKRVELAELELESLGAIVKRGAFTSRQGMMGFPFEPQSSQIQILIGEDWKGGDKGIDVFRRFSNLVGAPGRASNALGVYVLDGHPLTQQQLATLTEFVGRVAERGRVALGIAPNPRMVGRHVLIGTVAPGGSAEAAGLKPDDLIVAIENPNKQELKGQELLDAKTAEELRDFDDLVERLKGYRRGDVIQMRIVREFGRRGIFGSREQLTEEVVSVKLKGWEALKVN